MIAAINNERNQTSIQKVVIPFYVYASICYLAGCLLLLTSSTAFKGHYFNPDLLAITHTMALGWGTMMILGASYQLLPVLTGTGLYSTQLAHITFWLTGTGIPLLIYCFYLFRFDALTITAATLINLGIISYLINAIATASLATTQNIHSLFMITATIWLLATTLIGLLLVINFTSPLLDKTSLYYLNLHAHIGIVGWFLLMVTGVGAKLIPMFLISKYEDTGKLRQIYLLINSGIIVFILQFILEVDKMLFIIPVCLVAAALFVFMRFCLRAYKQRIRKQTDNQLKLSFAATGAILIPVISMAFLLAFPDKQQSHLPVLYGFFIFFGWITAMIVAMTFKTLPFIIWDKIYKNSAWKGESPDPKDLFSAKLFNVMCISYLIGFILFAVGIIYNYTKLLFGGGIILLIGALLYNTMVLGVVLHKKPVA